MKRVSADGARPASEIVAEERREWVNVRIVRKEAGLYLGIDAREGFEVGGVLIVPGVCVGVNRSEVDQVIEALNLLRGRLP